MRVLIDADIVVFRCGFAAEHMMWYLAHDRDERNQDGSMKEFDGFKSTEEFRYKSEAMERLDAILPGKHSRVEGEDYNLWCERQLAPVSHAYQNVNTLVGSIQAATGVTDFDTHMYLSSGKDSFRYDVATTRPYKGTRDNGHRPTHEAAIRDYIIEHWSTTVAEGEEADDLLGIEQSADPDGTIIASIDKDLNQIPGLKYNFVDDRTYEVTLEQAVYNFHIQLMAGDSTDNIPGLPGIGPGKAAKALHGITDPHEQQRECWRMYQIHSGVKDPWAYMIEQGQLLWIRREVGEMWQPVIQQEGEAWDAEDLSMF